MMFASRSVRVARPAVLAVFLISLIAAAAGAQDKPPVGTTGSTPPPMDKAMMEAMAKASTPGPNHQLLASTAGNWTYKVRMWMNPEAAPAEANGTATYTALLGGRFLEGRYHGDMMGMPFEGLGLTGFDNTTGQFEASWADNMGTSIMYMTGNYDQANKTITFTGQMDDIMNPGAKVNVREVVRLLSPDSQLMEWYETRGGKEVKTMEIAYTRAK